MAAHRHHGVVPTCRVLSTAEHQIAPSAVRSAMARPVCARRQADDAVKPLLLEVFNSNYRGRFLVVVAKLLVELVVVVR